MSTVNIHKMKLLHFPRYYTNYKIINPIKVRYLKSEKFGYFEAPRYAGPRELKHIVNNYQQIQIYEKFMNPKGLKYTFTKNFPKYGDVHDFVNFKVFVTRSQKQYADDEMKLKIPMNMSKPELKQFMEKLYGMKIQKISTSILPGKVGFSLTKKKYYRSRDVKKAVIKIDSKIDNLFRKIG